MCAWWVIQYQASSVAFILFLPVAMCSRCCIPCCGIHWQSSLRCKHCSEKDAWVGVHWISSTKLLKLAQLYPVYCKVVLMAFIKLGHLLIKKVFPMNIVNNSKYSGQCVQIRQGVKWKQMGMQFLITVVLMFMNLNVQAFGLLLSAILVLPFWLLWLVWTTWDDTTWLALGFPKCPAIVQTTLGAVKTWGWLLWCSVFLVYKL